MLKESETAKGQVNEIQVKTLLGLLKDYNVDRLDGMKIDIEGNEEAVLIPFLNKLPKTYCRNSLSLRIITINGITTYRRWPKPKAMSGKQ